MATLDAQYGNESTPLELSTLLYWDNSTRSWGGPRKKEVVEAITLHPTITWDITLTNRNTWNIYRAYYSSGYRIAGEDNIYASIGDYIDVRYTDDASRVSNEALFDQEYLDDVDLFNIYGTNTTFIKWLQHRHIYGTNHYGNLPEHKKHRHVGYCWAPCPHSTQSSDNRTRVMLGLASTDPLPTRNDHTSGGKVYYLKPHRRQAWGYVCPFETCPGKSGNIPYFYA